MDIVNRSRVDDGIVRTVAQRSLVAVESFVVFLDHAMNAVLADFSRTKLQEYRQKGWIPLSWWEKNATGDNDIHACTSSRRVIANQKLPSYVLDAIDGYELLLYLDSTWTQAPEMGFVLTLAHELRHPWQYFN